MIALVDVEADATVGAADECLACEDGDAVEPIGVLPGLHEGGSYCV